MTHRYRPSKRAQERRARRARAGTPLPPAPDLVIDDSGFCNPIKIAIAAEGERGKLDDMMSRGWNEAEARQRIENGES